MRQFRNIVVIVIIFSLLANILMLLGTRKWIHNLDSVPQVDTALILGARVWYLKAKGAHPSHILEDRLKRGIELYESGKISKMLLSGGISDTGFDETLIMREFLMNNGIPEEDLLLDNQGNRTYISCFNAARDFGLTSLTIVTNGYHLPRALFLAGAMGINALGTDSDLRPYQKMYKYQLREYISRTIAVLEVLLAKLWGRI